MIYLLFSYLLMAQSLDESFKVHFNPDYIIYDNNIDAGSYINLTHIETNTTHLADTNIPISKLDRDIFLLKKPEILQDADQRISKNFKIPKALKKRVGFWLDIYTKYDSNFVVLHDRDYPWVVYEVISIKQQMKGRGNYWARYHRAQKHISKRKRYWKSKILKLAKKSNFKKLSKNEKKIYRHFLKRKYIKEAALRIRSQTGQKDHFVKGLDRASPYLSQMEQIFANNKLPFELTRLPLVESSFNPKAESKVGAKGIWQIMPNIARKMKLLTGKKDKRDNIIASTKVAAKLFKQKFRSLKKWPLAVTAYNHGPSGVKKAMRILKTKSITRIIRKYESRRFGFASQNFYASFLAALYAERYQEVFFNNLDLNSLVSKTALPKQYY